MSINKPDFSKEAGNLNSIESDIEPIYSEQKSSSIFTNFVDGFRRQIPGEKDASEKNKVLTNRHLIVLALSLGVGTGLFQAAATKLSSGGPLFLLLAYIITGYLMLIPTMYSGGELAIAYSTSPGGFNDYYRKFMCESMAFALGWNYCFQWMTVISLELVTASLTIKFWTTSINPDIFVMIFLLVVVAINLCGAKGYGEAEFCMNTVKLVMLAGFIIFGICVDLGASSSGFIGGKYWRDPGYYTTFKALSGSFVTSAFSLGGTEFILLFVALQPNPRSSLRSAVKIVFFRITVFFLGSLTLVGLLVPYTSDELMGSGGSATHSSPYVLAATLHGVKVVPHIINAVILNSVTSVATAGMYSSSRLLYSLVQQGFAPKFLDYVDRTGRPLRCWLVTVAASFFGFIATYEKEETVFNWLLSISALSFIFVWMSISICHIRFRSALKYNNVPLSSLGFVSPFGVYGSYLSILINALILIAQFWVALFPIGSSKPDANSFFQNYLGVPFLLICYVGHKLVTRNWKLYIKTEEIDLDANRTMYDPEILELEELEDKEKFRTAPWWKKALLFMFK